MGVLKRKYWLNGENFFMFSFCFLKVNGEIAIENGIHHGVNR